MAQVSGKSCEICEQAPGLHYCLDCEQKFCEGCKVFHKKTKSTKHHEFQLATEPIPEVNSKCSDHKEHFNVFCTSCDIPVCSKCVTGKHNGHKFSEITDFIKQIKERNESKLQPKLEEIYLYITQVTSGLEKFECDTKYVIKSIEEEGVRIKAMVDKYIAETIKSLKEKAQQESKKVELALNEMKSQMQSIQHFDKTRKKYETARLDGALVKKLQTLEKDIDTLSLKTPPQLPSITFTKGQGRQEDVQRLLGTYNLSLFQQPNHRTMTPVRSSRTYEDTSKRSLRLCSMCGTKPADYGGIICLDCYRTYEDTSERNVSLCSECGTRPAVFSGGFCPDCEPERPSAAFKRFLEQKKLKEMS